MSILSLLIASGLFLNISTSTAWFAVTVDPLTLFPSSFAFSDNVADIRISAAVDKQLTVCIEYVSPPPAPSPTGGLLGDYDTSLDNTVWFDTTPFAHYIATYTGTTVSSSVPPSTPIVAYPNSELLAYQQTIQHVNDSGSVQWVIKIGSGGQIYSMIDSYGNELMGVLTQDYGLNQPNNAWMDRVYQPVFSANPTTPNCVADCNSGGYYIQVGAYPADTSGYYTPDYAQSLIEYFDAPTNSYFLWSWPLQAYTGDWSTCCVTSSRAYESQYLTQTQVRDMGALSPTVSGFEITYTTVNYGNTTINAFSAPYWDWNLANYTNLYISNATGGNVTQSPDTQTWNYLVSNLNAQDIGGWIAYSNNITGAPAVVAVFNYPGSSSQAYDLTINIGLQSTTTCPLREQINIGRGSGCYPNCFDPYSLAPTQIYTYRSYILFSTSNVSDAAVAANILAPYVVVNVTNAYPISETFTTQNCSLLAIGGITCSFYAFARPTLDPVPILLLQSLTNTSRYILSGNPYAFGHVLLPNYQAPTTSTTTKYIGFFGWGIRVTTATAPRSSMVKLSSILTSVYQYIDPQTYALDVWVNIGSVIAAATLISSTASVSSSAYSSSSSQAVGPFPLPYWVLDVNTASNVSVGLIQNSNFIDAGCNHFQPVVPVATCIGITTDPRFGQVPYDPDFCAASQRIAMRFPNNTLLNFSASSFTINMWISLAVVGTNTFAFFGPDITGNAFDGAAIMYEPSYGVFLADASNRVTGGYVNTGTSVTFVANQWYMITATYNVTSGSTATYSIYVNGQLIHSNVGGLHSSPFDSGMSIFNYGDGGGVDGYPAFVGSIYQTSVWLSVTPSVWIAQLYSISDITTLFTCPPVSSSSSTGGVAVSSSSSISVSSSSSSSVSNFPTPFWVMATNVSMDVAASTIVSSDFQDVGCNHFHPVVESATCLGIHNDTTFGEVLYQSGLCAANQRVAMQNVTTNDLNFGASSFSINMWILLYATTNTMVFFGPDVSPTQFDGPALMYDPTDGIYLADNTNRGTGGYVSTGNSVAFAIDQWYMVTVTYNVLGGGSASYSIYINNALHGAFTGAVHTDAFTSGVSLSNYGNSGGVDGYAGWYGELYQPAVWLKALTTDAINTLYNTHDIRTLYSC